MPAASAVMTASCVRVRPDSAQLRATSVCRHCPTREIGWRAVSRHGRVATTIAYGGLTRELACNDQSSNDDLRVDDAARPVCLVGRIILLQRDCCSRATCTDCCGLPCRNCSGDPHTRAQNRRRSDSKGKGCLDRIFRHGLSQQRLAIHTDRLGSDAYRLRNCFDLERLDTSFHGDCRSRTNERRKDVGWTAGRSACRFRRCCDDHRRSGRDFWPHDNRRADRLRCCLNLLRTGWRFWSSLSLIGRSAFGDRGRPSDRFEHNAASGHAHC